MTASESMLELERKINAWLDMGWSEKDNAYPLPFWVFYGQNHEEFVAMLQRFRATWSFVGCVQRHDTNMLEFRR